MSAKDRHDNCYTFLMAIYYYFYEHLKLPSIIFLFYGLREVFKKRVTSPPPYV